MVNQPSAAIGLASSDDQEARKRYGDTSYRSI